MARVKNVQIPPTKEISKTALSGLIAPNPIKSETVEGNSMSGDPLNAMIAAMAIPTKVVTKRSARLKPP